ncbi:MAG: hypothetical protein ABR599_11335 [Gemmatimonadota bacterium]
MIARALLLAAPLLFPAFLSLAVVGAKPATPSGLPTVTALPAELLRARAAVPAHAASHSSDAAHDRSSCPDAGRRVEPATGESKAT